MAKTFRPWDVEQSWLLPPSVQDLVPPGHAAHFVRDLVRESLDLSSILGEYSEERGYPPYHPVMMTALLLYAYSQGIYSSRRIARACEQRVDFMAVTALQRPDFRTINSFRARHLAALSGLFEQVLHLCQQSGLVKLGHVALDGTKIRANASKRKAMSYQRMTRERRRLEGLVREWLERAEQSDLEEDALYGVDRRGDELPAWVADKAERVRRIRQAQAELEAEARERDRDAIEREAERSGRGPGRPRKRPLGVPDDGAQRNFTDPDSRIMKTPDGFQQCYNAQAAVDAAHQVIVAHGLTPSATDRNQLVGLLDRIRSHLRADPQEISADCDYCTEANLEEIHRRKVRGYIATGKQLHGRPAPTTTRRAPPPGTRRRAMKTRLQRAGYRSRYRLRKQTVEPVFGQIKEARGFRRFLLRGADRVAAEWAMVCTAHNLCKLLRARA